MNKKFRETRDKMYGPLVPINPAFKEDGSIDIDSTCRWINWLVENGIQNFWTTGGTTHYFCLTDEEIYTLNKEIADCIGARATFIASVNWHWPVPMIKKFIDFAAGCGIDVVKVMLDARFHPRDKSIIDCYAQIADGSALPLLAYSLAPDMLSYDALRKLVEIPEYIGLKNDAGDFYQNFQYLRIARQLREDFMIITGGTITSFMMGYNFGQRLYGDVVAMYSPKTSLECYEAIKAGDIKKASDIIKEYEEPIMQASFEIPDGYWTVYHTILKVKGLFDSNHVRYPQATLTGDLKKIAARYVPERDLEPVII